MRYWKKKVVSQATNLTHTYLCVMKEVQYKAIEMEYGTDFTKERVVGCQWHFQNDMTQKSWQVGQV